MVVHPSGGPDPDEVFLRNQIGPEDPRYEDMCKRLGKTPEGKRIIKHNKDNEKYEDRLNEKNPQKLAVIIRAEGATYAGDPMDRISMIDAIRKHRDENKDKMTLQEREVLHKKQVIVDEEDGAKAKAAASKKKREDLKERWKQRKIEKDAAAQPGRDYLDEEAANRVGKINPVEARKKAREKEEDSERHKVKSLREIRLKELKGLKPEPLVEIANDYSLEIEEDATKKDYIELILGYEFPEE